MVVHDDDVALRRAAMHLRDKAAVPLRAFLPGAALGASVEFLPELCVFRQAFQFGAVSALSLRLPLRDLAVLINLLQAVQDRLVGQVIKFLPAEIIVAS